jgi:DAK2 domain fusion protein YloV
MATAAQAADLVLAWSRHALNRLGEEREEIDRLNVFPVPDGDTGTNMYLTMESAVLAVDAMSADRPDGALGQRWEGADPQTLRLLAIVQTLARGALMGARGNSGVIMSQVLRGMLHGEVRPDATGDSFAGGHLAATALQAASTLAYQSVGKPVEGTMLTVVRAAAEAASEAAEDGHSFPSVITRAADAARTALAETPKQLPALAAAGVVDSGGAGIAVIIDAMAEVVTGTARPVRPAPKPDLSVADAGHEPHANYDGPAYEVMYLLDAADDDGVAELRERLGALGDSLVVVGGDGLWNVHVHVDDAGAAVESALAIGRPHRIRITWLREAFPEAPAARGGRAIIAVSHGDGVADLLRAAGAVAVPARPRISPSTGEMLAAIEASGASEVVLLPGGKDIRPAAEAAATRAREVGVRVAVIPTRAIVQSLAAVAVHEPSRGFDDDVASMSRAAGATRYGGVTVASKRAMTSAGVCEPGDVLGLVSGDIVKIGTDELAVAQAVVGELVRGDSELVTLLTGADSSAEDAETMAAAIEDAYPELDVVAESGGQPLWPVIIGVE